MRFSSSIRTAGLSAASLGLAWATSSVRADLGVANVALGLAVITATAGLLSWTTGVVVSIVSAFSLNYFHTEPVHSLRIGSSSDVVMVILLTAIGISVSATTAIRTRRRMIEIGRTSERRSADLLLTALRDRSLGSQAGHLALDSCDQSLQLTDVQLVPSDATRADVPVIARPIRPTFDHGDHNNSVVLPEVGAIVEFGDPRIPFHLVLAPREGSGSLAMDRASIFVLADAIEVALRRHGYGTRYEGAD